MKSVYRRCVSAPCCSMTASGLTTLPLDFDIFSSLPVISDCLQIIPWVKRAANGSLKPTWPAS